MKFVNEHKTAFIFSLCAALVILILIYFGTHSSGPTAVEDAVMTTVSPVQKFFKNIGSGFYDITHCIGEIKELRNQKAELESKNAELEDRAGSSEELRAENDRLRRMLELRRDSGDYELTACSVVADEPSNRFAAFTIDKGRNSGISEGQPVVTADKVLIGKITRVGANWAEVTTVVDPGFSAGAKVRRSNDMGVAEGDSELREKFRLKLSYLERETDIEENDTIVTTGLGGVFPDGLKIGKVLEIKEDNVSMSRYAIIEPIADLKDVREVFVITNNLDVVADRENENMKAAREDAEKEQDEIDKKAEEAQKAQERNADEGTVSRSGSDSSDDEDDNDDISNRSDSDSEDSGSDDDGSSDVDEE